MPTRQEILNSPELKEILKDYTDVISQGFNPKGKIDRFIEREQHKAKKDDPYTIIAIKSKTGGVLFSLGDDGLFYKSETIKVNGETGTAGRQFEGFAYMYDIVAVKRNSDDEVFRIGDTVRHISNNFETPWKADIIKQSDFLGISFFDKEKNSALGIMFAVKVPAPTKEEEVTDAEILSFINIHHKTIWKKGTNGRFFFGDSHYSSGSTEKWLLSKDVSEFYQIHSIKRLSDGQVFTIGDRVDAETSNITLGNSAIFSFKKTDEGIRVQVSDSNAHDWDYGFDLKCITKIEILGKTQDGHDIVEGMKLWQVPEGLSQPVKQVAEEKGFKEWIEMKKPILFRDLYKAERYIIEHARVLCLDDVLKLGRIPAQEAGLFAIVKERLKKQ